MRAAPSLLGRTRGRALRLGMMIHIAVVALLLQILLRFDLSRVLLWLDVERSDRELDPAASGELAAAVTEVIGRLGGLIGSVCLTRTLTLFYYLRRRGVPLEVHLGIDHNGFDEPAGLQAHCWLVYDHMPVLERRDPRQRYRAIYRYFSGSNRQLNIPLEIVEEEAGEVIAAARHGIA